MTHVEFNFPDINGEPSQGSITFTPTRNNRHNSGVSLPSPFAVNIGKQGTFSVDLKPTTVYWTWRINIQVDKHPWTTEYYYVPDRNFPIRFEDLTPVDPATIQTGLNPEPAWWAHVSAVKVSADEIAELAHSARTEVSGLADAVGNIQQAHEEAVNDIDAKVLESARNLSRSEAILAEVRRLLDTVERG